MTSVGGSNPLAGALNNAFSKFDRDGNGKLNAEEFRSFNEILKPGIALDKEGRPTVDYSTAMDRDADTMITRDEMNSTGVIMPAGLADSLEAMFNYLLANADSSALTAAAALKPEPDRQS